MEMIQSKAHETIQMIKQDQIEARPVMMASPEPTPSENVDLDVHEHGVTTESIKEPESSLILVHVDPCDVNTTLRIDPTTPLNKTHKLKRRYRRNIQDLVREKSPQPQDYSSITLNDISTCENKDGGQENSSSQTDNGAQANELPLVFIVDGKRSVCCNICKRQMSESKLANHIRLMHIQPERDNPESTPKKYRCEQCGKSYAARSTFQQHIVMHIEGRPKCLDCGSTFASPFSLFRHRVKKHDLEHNFTSYKCDDCDKTFFSISELTLHSKRHSATKEFACGICGNQFGTKGNLNTHMRSHSKEKEYRCDICERDFAHPNSLLTHRRTHSNELPYNCDQCGKNFRTPHQLSSHSLVHSDERPYKCTKCPKSFKSRTAFKMHQDHHQGIKRYSCQYCERLFQCQANKIKHERRHTSERSRKCPRCDKTFYEKQELKNHMKAHDRMDRRASNSSKPGPRKEPRKSSKSRQAEQT